MPYQSSELYPIFKEISLAFTCGIPDIDLLHFLKGYGQLKSHNLGRLFFAEPGFMHIERGIPVAEFMKIDRHAT